MINPMFVTQFCAIDVFEAVAPQYADVTFPDCTLILLKHKHTDLYHCDTQT